MKTPSKITRAHLVDVVANGLPHNYSNDLPAIRQALNDTADSYRKDGFKVGDFNQDICVRLVRQQMKN